MSRPADGGSNRPPLTLRQGLKAESKSREQEETWLEDFFDNFLNFRFGFHADHLLGHFAIFK